VVTQKTQSKNLKEMSTKRKKLASPESSSIGRGTQISQTFRGKSPLDGSPNTINLGN